MNVEKSERPWGIFKTYAKNEKCTVKVHHVGRGHSTSLQKHDKRTEFFIPLDHGIIVEVDGKRIEAMPGDEIHVPIGVKHRFSSIKDGARILEISFGEFLEEDITRFEDNYGRVRPTS
jgi:mannose-6-phosphate isomerase-like protein (cupin superfamily)